MNLSMRYYLVGGTTFEHVTGDFGSVQEARDACSKMFAQPGSVASLNGPRGVEVVNVANIAVISITPEVKA